MKKSVFSLFFILFLGLLLTANTDSSLNNLTEYTREIDQSFDIGTNANVSIHNKYGSVNIKTDGVSKAEFHIQILVKSNNKSKAEDLLKKIDVDFDHSSNSVSAETRINTSENWWNKLFKSSRLEYEINYEVRIPASSALELSNKYGNSYIGSLNNDLEAEIKYGNLEFEKIDGNVEIELGYGKLIGIQCQAMEADVSYSSEFRIQSVNNLDMTSKYSKIFFDEVGDADIESGYDEYHILTVGNLENSGKYDDFSIDNARAVDFESRHTNVKIGFLERDAAFDIKYGKVIVDQSSSSLSEIEIETEYVDVRINIPSEYIFEAELKYIDFSDPSNFSGDREVNSNTQVFDGFVGSNSASTSVSAIMKYGTLKINK